MQSSDGDTQEATTDLTELVGPFSVTAAVARDLNHLRTRAPGLADSSLAAAAMTLALELDNDRNSATSKSMCARALLELMDRLAELAPPAKEADRLNDLASRRAARRLEGGAAPTD